MIDCDPLEPVELKGKAAAVAVWSARQARSRYGVAVEESGSVQFVGRQEELSLLSTRWIAPSPGVGRSS